MNSWRVTFAPEAADQLVELHEYLAIQAGPAVAGRYAEAVISRCESLALLPFQGVHRDDIRPGLRVTHYRGRTIIAFAIDAELARITILGVFHGGRDYERHLTGSGGTDSQA